MKVLIIEDDANKLRAISKVLEQHTNIEQNKKMSYHSGMKEIYNSSYDLVLLDMSMPMYDVTARDTGGRPLPTAGKDILFKMQRSNVKTQVIVVTQYEEFEGISLLQLDRELRENYPNIYKGYIYYNTTQEDWKEHLRKMLTVTEDRMCDSGINISN